MMNIICFHNPDEENGYLSNWYPSSFTHGAITYTSLEQYMMVQKALCFHDTTMADLILSTHDVAMIKAYGRQVANYNDHIWSGIRQVVVYTGLIAKFSQNSQLKDLLLSTNDAILAECAVNDTIWGIGLSMKDPLRFHMDQWKGKNLLGYALMMVRDQLKTMV